MNAQEETLAAVSSPADEVPFTRHTPRWQVLTFYYGLGLAVSWQLVEDIMMGQGAVHAGSMAPWRQWIKYSQFLGTRCYPFLASLEAILLVLYFLQIRPRLVATCLGCCLFLDNLGCFLNHRLLMSLEMFAVGLVAPPRLFSRQEDEREVLYWNLDLVRFQVSFVYIITGIYKCNVEFLSGRTLHNLFFVLQEQGMQSYPDFVFGLIQDPNVCLAMGVVAVFLEFALPIGLHSQRWSVFFVAIAFAMHIAFSLLMPYLWIFTTQMLFTLTLFIRLPFRKNQLAPIDGP